MTTSEVTTFQTTATMTMKNLKMMLQSGKMTSTEKRADEIQQLMKN